MLKLKRLSVLLLVIFCLLVFQTSSFAAESIAETISSAIAYIKRTQNPDGGWPLIPGRKSQVHTTALALNALILADENGSQKQIDTGIDYLLKNQSKEGHWNKSSVDTALALVPLSSDISVSGDVRFKALQWLNEVQKESGSWSNIVSKRGTVVATSKVVVCLERLRFDEGYTPFRKATRWIANYRSYDGGWAEIVGHPSNTEVTAWALYALASSYDIDEPMAWFKRSQNSDYGFGMAQGRPSDAELTAYAIMALVAGEDPLHSYRKARRYLMKTQNRDGSFTSDLPEELDKPKPNLQTTCYAIWAIYAEKIHKGLAE